MSRFSRPAEFKSLLEARSRGEEDPAILEQIRKHVIMEMGPQAEQDDAQAARTQRISDVYQRDSDASETLQAQEAAKQEQAQESKLDRYSQALGQAAPKAPAPMPGMGDLRVAEAGHQLPQGPIEAPPQEAVGDKTAPPPQADPGEEVRSYIRKKYGFHDELNDAALKDAQRQQRYDEGEAMLLGAGQGFNEAISGAKVDKDFFNQLNAQAGRGVADIQTRRKGLKEEQAYGKTQEAQDPNSSLNSMARSALAQVMPKLAKSPGFNSLTVDNFEPLKQLVAMKMTADSTAATREQTNAFREQGLSLKQKEADDRNRRADDGKIQNFTNQLMKDDIPGAINSIDHIEKILGSIDKLTNKSDLPGYGRLVSLGADFMQSEKGQQLRQEVEGMASAIRHSKYGSALTRNEAEYYLRESGSGRLMPDARLVQFLQRAKKDLRDHVRVREAGVPEQARGRAREATGVDSQAPFKSDRQGDIGPKAGDVEDGHRFKGGDPSDPNNWEAM